MQWWHQQCIAAVAAATSAWLQTVPAIWTAAGDNAALRKGQQHECYRVANGNRVSRAQTLRFASHRSASHYASTFW
jgi:hypothetical protein